MLSKTLVACYINNLTIQEGIALASKQGVDFSVSEAKIILPFLKEHRYQLDLESKDYLLKKARPLLSDLTYMKVERLLKNCGIR